MIKIMNCVFYCNKLHKKIPCILIPGKLYSTTDNMKRKTYVHVYFDSSKFEEYSLSEGELNRYCSEFVNIHDIYPNNTQSQKDYANLVIPNGFTNNTDELDRYEAIINMITNVDGNISKDIFYILSDIVSYELLFTRCNHNERVFMMSLSIYKFDTQPNVIEVPQMIRMTKRLFDKYSLNIDNEYDLNNYNNYYLYDSILPITLNIENLKHNVNYISI